MFQVSRPILARLNPRVAVLLFCVGVVVGRRNGRLLYFGKRFITAVMDRVVTLFVKVVREGGGASTHVQGECRCGAWVLRGSALMALGICTLDKGLLHVPCSGVGGSKRDIWGCAYTLTWKDDSVVRDM